jgi:DNA-binding transcriptional MerR regulator
MARIADTLSLVDNIVRLRRAERIRRVAPDVAPVRRQLEGQLGPTLSRSRAGKILGVSQTALDRWVAAGQIPVVITPSGRREVPRQVVLELRESLDRLRLKGITRHPLSAALAERREKASRRKSATAKERGGPLPTRHDTAERRSLAYHRAVAERLDDSLVAEARDRVDRLAAEGHMHPTYAKRWREALALPIVDLAAAIAADTQDARDLRQSSPFAGVLNEYERRRIIESVR